LRKIERGIWIIEKTSIWIQEKERTHPRRAQIAEIRRIVDLLLFGDGGR
jgi:hypothetical protein